MTSDFIQNDLLPLLEMWRDYAHDKKDYDYASSYQRIVTYIENNNSKWQQSEAPKDETYQVCTTCPNWPEGVQPDTCKKCEVKDKPNDGWVEHDGSKISPVETWQNIEYVRKGNSGGKHYGPAQYIHWPMVLLYRIITPEGSKPFSCDDLSLEDRLSLKAELDALKPTPKAKIEGLGYKGLGTAAAILAHAEKLEEIINHLNNEA